METVSDGTVSADRCRHGDRRVVEQVLREADERRLQRLRDQQSREARAVDEQVAADGGTLPSAQRGDGAMLIEVGLSDMRREMADAALQRLFVQELTQQHGIEVIAVPDVEREVLGGLRCKMLGGEPRRDEEAVRMRVHVGAVDARIGVVHELRHGQVVEHGRERMKVALEARLGRPAVEGDAALVGGVALGHPFGFFYSQAVEEAAQPGRRTLADADDADRRATRPP